MKKNLSPIILLIGLSMYAIVISLLSGQAFKVKAYEELRLKQVYPKVEKNEVSDSEISQGEVKGVADGIGSNVCKSSNCGCEECIVDAKEGNYYPLTSDGVMKVTFQGYTKPKVGEKKEIKIKVNKITWPNQVYAGFSLNSIHENVNPTYPITFIESELPNTPDILGFNAPEAGEALTYMFPANLPPGAIDEGGKYQTIYETKEGTCQLQDPKSEEFIGADSGPFAVQYTIRAGGGSGLKVNHQSTPSGTFTIYDNLGTSANPDKLNKMAYVLASMMETPDTNLQEVADNYNQNSGENVRPKISPAAKLAGSPGNEKIIELDTTDNYICCIDKCEENSKEPEYVFEAVATMTDEAVCSEPDYIGDLWECEEKYEVSLELGGLTGSNYGCDQGFCADYFYDLALLKEYAPNGVPEELKATIDNPSGTPNTYLRDVLIKVPCSLSATNADVSGVSCFYPASFIQAHLYFWLNHSKPSSPEGVQIYSNGYTFEDPAEAFWTAIIEDWQNMGETCTQ